MIYDFKYQGTFKNLLNLGKCVFNSYKQEYNHIDMLISLKSFDKNARNSITYHYSYHEFSQNQQKDSYFSFERNST